MPQTATDGSRTSSGSPATGPSERGRRQGGPIPAYFGELWHTLAGGWQQFWFEPADPAPLCGLRVLLGAMLFYTHLVWSIDLLDFFGPDAWVSPAAMAAYFQQQTIDQTWAFSHFWFLSSPAAIWAAHIAALVVFALLTLGLFSRTMAVLAWLLTVSYAHRAHGALFGLDQINGFLAMYVMLGPSGALWSLDRWRLGAAAGPVAPSVSANVAVRLIQVHMCVVYFFAGASKLAGASWWDGTAMWLSFASGEYQTVDLTWLAHFPYVVNAMTFSVVLWELSYPALIWPRLTRPLVLAFAVVTHLAIGLCLGMMTFGLVMLLGNAAFVPAGVWRAAVTGLTSRAAGLARPGV